MLIEQAIALRPTTPLDQSFLYHLYISTRTPEPALIEWSKAPAVYQAMVWQPPVETQITRTRIQGCGSLSHPDSCI